MTLSTKIEVFYGFYICSQRAFIHALLSRVPFALAGLSCCYLPSTGILCSMHYILSVLSNYIFFFAHVEPRHQWNESSAMGSFHQTPQSKDIRSAILWSYACKMQLKIFTVHSHIHSLSKKSPTFSIGFIADFRFVSDSLYSLLYCLYSICTTNRKRSLDFKQVWLSD